MARLKILVADDESLIRLGLKTMLTELGYDVALAANGREALALARGSTFDLALLDINMPLTDGLETAKVLARKHPLPILFLTAYSDPALIERAAQLPIQGYLVKPVAAADLAAAIPIALARYAEAAALARDKAELQETLDSRKWVDRAKGRLIEQGLTEEAAYQHLQQEARRQRISVRQAAEQILQEGRRP